MKKLALSTAILATLAASSAVASDLSVDVYGDRGFKGEERGVGNQGVIVGYNFDNGLGLAAEATTKKDLDLEANWKFDLDGGSYVKPSIGYVFKKSLDSATLYKTDNDSLGGAYDYTYLKTNNSNVAKIGVEFGSTWNNFISSARVRYEADMEKFDAKTTSSYFGAGGNEVYGKAVDSKLKSETARLDLMIGYNFDHVTLTAKSIQKYELNKDLKGINSRIDKDNEKFTQELKATITAFDGVAPYIQYTNNNSFMKGDKSDQIIKLGAKFSF